MPIGTRQSRASGFSWISSQFAGGISCGLATPPPCDMLSTPAPMPASIAPDQIAAATFATACSPDEHWRLTAYSGVSAGSPARSAAIRAGPAYAPLICTLPTHTSWI